MSVNELGAAEGCGEFSNIFAMQDPQEARDFTVFDKLLLGIRGKFHEIDDVLGH